MEPYVIICQSCTARLKVSNEALIGQRLACPKCQAMIDVVAPKGYQPPTIADDSQTEISSESSLSGNFEDIDSLLANVQQGHNKEQPKREPKPKAKAKTNQNSKTKAKTKPKLTPPAPVQAAGSQSKPDRAKADVSHQTASAHQQRDSDPSLIPNSQWDSEAARKKKRILQFVMLGALATVTIGAGVWALLNLGPTEKADDTIAKNDLAVVQSPTDTDPESTKAAQPDQETQPPNDEAPER